MNQKVFSAVIKVFMIFWPVFIFFAVQTGQLKVLVWFTLITLILRIITVLFFSSLHKVREVLPSIGIVALLTVALVIDRDELVFWYPVLMNVGLFLVFASTLIKGKPIIQQLAEISPKGNPLPKEGISYTRNLTKVWCVFFLLNGSIALWTCLQGNLNVWTFYNGFLSYCFISLLFGLEFLYRKMVIHE